VGIGGALAEARSEAGLTITQVSERTRIRETIIRDIERDDYSACGGDFYTRGHIRAIARVVGTDPVPLIEEYDGAGVPAGDGDAPGGIRTGGIRTGGIGSGGIGTGGIGPAEVDPDADTNPGLLNGDFLEFDLPGRLWPETRLLARGWVATVSSRLAGAAPARTVAGA
jgi:transcriptional regulator with XRE-family HTH domain